MIGDNIDKHVKPRYQRVDSQSQSLHYFQVYCVKDRVNLSHLPDYCEPVQAETFPFQSLLPTEDDLKQLLHNMAILLAQDLSGI